MADAQRAFAAPGLRAPWYPLVGNHDVLVQGEIAPTRRTNAVATGDRAVRELDPSLPVPRSERALSAATIDGLLAGGVTRTGARVAPDPQRQEPAAHDTVRALREASGHGGRGATMDDVVDLGRDLRLVLLDIVRRDQGSGGLVGAAQVRFLRRALARAGGRRVIVVTHQSIPGAEGAEPLLAVMDGDPRVVAAVAGSSHRNRIIPRRTAAGGYWLITTSSLVDYPQQVRAFRLVRTQGGGMALETWMVDHARRDGLAGISRELAYLDVQGGRPQGFAGARRDGNVRLVLPGAPGSSG
jgi:hypothetical protein